MGPASRPVEADAAGAAGRTTTVPRLLLHHAPKSRFSGSLRLLEEAGADYGIAWHSIGEGPHEAPACLATNPAGTLPALVDRGPRRNWKGVVVTEGAAIAAHVADLIPEAHLATARHPTAIEARPARQAAIRHRPQAAIQEGAAHGRPAP